MRIYYPLLKLSILNSRFACRHVILAVANIIIMPSTHWQIEEVTEGVDSPSLIFNSSFHPLPSFSRLYPFPPPLPSHPLPPTPSPLLLFPPLSWSGGPGVLPTEFFFISTLLSVSFNTFQRNKTGFCWWVWPRENTHNYHLWLLQITKLCKSDVRPWRGYMLRLNVCICWGWIEAPLICLSLIVS